MNNKISVIIPAKDEESSIEGVVKRAKLFTGEVIVVDGFSTDKTAVIAEKAGAVVYGQKGLKGKGVALVQGAQKAKGDILVFVDADGSHELSDIPNITKPIIENNADMVITSRGRGGSDELHGDVEKFIRLVGSSIITLVINIRFGVQFTDSQNGFRAIRKDVFLELNVRAKSFAIEQEMLIRAIRKGKKIEEVPSHEYERAFGKSKINLWRMTPVYLWSLLKGIL